MTQQREKFMEVNLQHNNMRAIEKDSNGRIVKKSSFMKFSGTPEAVGMSLYSLFGYEFHHGGDLIKVYHHVGVSQ